VITIHQRHRRTDRRTDGQTDRQTTCDRNTALCTKVHRAVMHFPLTPRSMTLDDLTYKFEFSGNLAGLAHPVSVSEIMFSFRYTYGVCIHTNLRRRYCRTGWAKN